MTAVLHGDCLAILPTLPPDSFDSCVTDPPYHLVSIVKRMSAPNAAPVGFGSDGRYRRLSGGFMGKQWDGGDIAARVETWAEVYRVLKPGAHLVAFGGTRTYHRMACAIEDAGFEIRDCIQWIYGSGFPKSHDVSKTVDATILHGGSNPRRMKLVNEQRPGDGRSLASLPNNGIMSDDRHARVTRDQAATLEGAQWQGWGTALKPACEPIVLARKPLSEGTVAANVLRWGTGAINVDGCRIPSDDGFEKAWDKPVVTNISSSSSAYGIGKGTRHTVDLSERRSVGGRWPANVVHDGSAEVVAGFPDAGGGYGVRGESPNWGPASNGGGTMEVVGYGDSGSAARFFYTAKADGDERIGSKHPTVKPIDLMQWLVRLVTPKGGAVLDPFAGSGTTGEAAWREGCRATLIEREAEYLADIARRMELMKAGPDERAREIVKASGKAQGHEDLPLFNRQWTDMWARPFDKPELVWGKK